MATVQLEHRSTENPAPHPLHWSRERYYKLAEQGWFEGRRVELIEGEIIEMSPMGSAHWVTVAIIDKVLQRAFGDDCLVVSQLPISLTDDTEPEPDIAVVAGKAHDYLDGHPSTALLVVEVSDSSLQYDRQRKARIYAAADINEYWIVDVKQQSLEVRRTPRMADSGYEYAELKVYGVADTITPLAAPSIEIKVAELLPHKE